MSPEQNNTDAVGKVLELPIALDRVPEEVVCLRMPTTSSPSSLPLETVFSLHPSFPSLLFLFVVVDTCHKLWSLLINSHSYEFVLTSFLQHTDSIMPIPSATQKNQTPLLGQKLKGNIKILSQQMTSICT